MPDKLEITLFTEALRNMITKTQNMENQSRIEELLSDALRKYDQMLEKHDETNRRLTNVEGQLGRLENLEEKLGSADGKLGRLENLDQKLSSLDQKLGNVDQKLGNVEMKLERLDGRLGTLQMKVEISNQRLGNLEGQSQKLNLQTGENTRAIIRLGDELQRVFEHEKRIDILERAVFK